MPTTIFGDEATAPAQTGRTTVFGDPVHDSTPGYQRLAAAGKYTDPNSPPVYVTKNADGSQTTEEATPLNQIAHSLKSQAKGLFDQISALANPTSPESVAYGTNMVQGVVDHTSDNWKKAKEAYSKGDYFGALAHAGQAIPVVGSMVDKASTDIVEGRPFGAATDLAAAPLLTKGLGVAGELADGATGATIAGAAKGAKAAAMAPAAMKVRGIPIEAPVPASVAGAVSGATAGHFIAGPTGATVGAAVGGLAPLVKGAVAGGKAGLSEFRAAQAAAARYPRPAPPWMQQEVRPSPGMPTEAPVDVPNVHPSGRVAGGIQNQVEISPAAVDPLDAIAADLGYKKPYSQLPTRQKMEVNIAQRAAAQQATKNVPAAAVVPGDVGPAIRNSLQKPPANNIDRALADLGNKLLPPGKKLGAVDRQEGPVHFEEGKAESVIDSSKSRFNGPVANPQSLKAGQAEAVITSLEKIANPNTNQIALLKQLRDEVKRRGQ